MKLYWQERKAGQRLILADEDDTEVEVGAVRKTPRGYDALAKTNTYDPGRAQKDFANIEQAKAFVEEFHPWDLFGGDLDMDVEPEVRLMLGQPTSSGPPDVPPENPVEVAGESGQETQDTQDTVDKPVQVAAEERGQEAVDEPVQVAAEERGQEAEEEKQPQKRGWRFWQRT